MSFTDWSENKGVCPVTKGTLVDVQYRDGEIIKKLPAGENYPTSRNAGNAFWELDGYDNDIFMWRLHKPVEVVNTEKPYMNENQFEIYKKNFLVMTEGLQAVGGNVEVILRRHAELLETLARNGMEIKVTLHPNVDK